jgi:RND family efflux transporter MFP subunit
MPSLLRLIFKKQTEPFNNTTTIHSKFKHKNMKSINNYFTWILVIAMMFASCKNAGNNDSKILTEKKEQLQKLTTEKNKLDDAIKKLQAEISLLDTNAANQSKFTLVAITAVGVQKFDHYIDLRGRVDAENISYISPRGMGGQVKELYVKEGDNVKKGQLLLKLDDAIMKQSIAAARQQLEGIKTQLNFAKDVYDRQNKLWQKGIGTEVQVIGAKTNVEALQNQLKSAEEQLKVGQEQLNTSAVYSDVDGVAETVMVKVGELFGGMGQIKIVNTSKLKVVANVPENYITQVKQGLPVLINVAEAGKTINSNISLIGQTIENSQRGFIAEAKIASENFLKPNQSVVMKILDYTSPNAVVIPINTLQSDENNKYVYVMEKLSNGKTVATRKVIVLGQVYGDLVEVKSGLTGGEQLITAGYQNLYEGQVVTTEMK